MRPILSIITFLLISISVFAQYPTFRIDYKFFVDDALLQTSEEKMDENKKALITTAALALAFQDGDNPIAQVWVNKKFVRAKTSLYGDNYEINNKIDQQSFMVYPDTKEYYKSFGNADKLLDLGDDYKIASELPIEFDDKQTKQIAGYTCKLATITADDSDEVTTTIQVWYTEHIPAAYWGEYIYLKNIPGAALEISTLGIGIQASNIEPENDINIFNIPDDYAELDPNQGLIDYVDTDTTSLTEYEIGENLFAYYDEELGLYGIKDSEGKIISTPLYLSIQPYINDFAIVCDSDNLFGTIDFKGKVMIPLEFESLYFSEQDNCFTYAKNGKFGLLDYSGKVIIPNHYDNITFLKDDLAIVTVNEKYGIINKSNKIVVPPTYEYITEHTKKYFIVYEDKTSTYKLYSIHDQKQNASYDYITDGLQDELFLVTKDSKYGFINGEGKIIIPIKYAYAASFFEGTAMVMENENDEPFYINSKGEIVKK